MIHCLAPAGCCSQMGALPTTAAQCRLRTPLAWPTHAALPSPSSPAPPSLPRSVGGSRAAPSPGRVTGMGATAIHSHGMDGVQPAPSWAGASQQPPCKCLGWSAAPRVPLLSPYKNGEPLAAGRAGCCIPKYPTLSPIHFYSQSENNLPYNNTDTHSTALGTCSSGRDATAQASPGVRGEPQPGELCPFSIPRGAPTPSCSEHNLACGWRNLCTVLVCPPHFPPTLGSPCPAVHEPPLLQSSGCQRGLPHPRPTLLCPSAAGARGLYSVAVRSPGPGALVLRVGLGGSGQPCPSRVTTKC